MVKRGLSASPALAAVCASSNAPRRSIPRRLSYGWDSSGVSSSYIAVEGLYDEGFSDMAAWRRAIELSLGETDLEKLRLIARSRTEAASRVERARILLGYWENSSFFAVGQALGLHHQTVQRCVERAVAEDPMAALDDRPRPGREPSITLEAKAWLTSLSCRKAKELGYPHELWTMRLLARHAREHGPAEGHAAQGPLLPGEA